MNQSMASLKKRLASRKLGKHSANQRKRSRKQAGTLGAAVPRVLLIMLMDVLATMVSFFAGLWLRFDFVFSDISQVFLDGYIQNIGLWCAITVAVFFVFNLYNSIWVFVSLSEVFRIIGALA